MTDEELYFWGMFKKKWDNRFKKEENIVCSQCGSKRIYKITLQEPVFVEVSIPYKCNDCGYQGKPKVINSEEKQKIVKK
jgi:DNA-directed RNA polymerase subunit RPC12/RpoP